MAQASDFAARGKVTAVVDGKVIFSPSNTNYAIQLTPSRPFDGPIGQLISGIIRIKARKVYTVPSGGGFISPLFGPPRTIQGRAVHVESGMVVIRAGMPVIVEIPNGSDAIDLEEGPISVGSIVNAAVITGAIFEAVEVPVS